MANQFEEVVSQIAAELMNRNHYSRDNVRAAYRLLDANVQAPVSQSAIKAAVDSLNLRVIEDDEPEPRI